MWMWSLHVHLPAICSLTCSYCLPWSLGLVWSRSPQPSTVILLNQSNFPWQWPGTSHQSTIMWPSRNTTDYNLPVWCKNSTSPFCNHNEYMCVHAAIIVRKCVFISTLELSLLGMGKHYGYKRDPRKLFCPLEVKSDLLIQFPAHSSFDGVWGVLL